MGRSLTNSLSQSYAIEDSPGVLADPAVFKELEPNTISNLGATITTLVRTPISKSRQRKKGTTVDLDSAAEFDGDLTMEHIRDFIEGFMFSRLVGPLSKDSYKHSMEATASGYSYDAEVGSTVAQNTLVYARGFLNSVNNGLKVVNGASTTSLVGVSGLVAETPGATTAARVEVAGVRGASGDLEIDVDGNLISTTLDFTTLGLTAGQAIHIGGIDSANRFANADNYGFARVLIIAANKLTLDKRQQTYSTDAGTGRQVDILFGQYCRNVPTSSADYLERTYQIEVAYDNLAANGDTEYEYATGNFANELTINLPLTDKATIQLGFVGQDTEPPSTTRKNGAANAIVPQETSAFNTVADIGRLRVTEEDETGITTDFKNLTLRLRNNVTPEKVLGQFGAKFTNAGIFEVDMEAQLVFTNSAVAEAVRSNTTLQQEFSIRNADGGVFFDIPSLTFGSGDKEFPVGESILINVTGEAFEDPDFGTSLAVTMFPVLPEEE